MSTEKQERWGAAVAILSLDVIVPFYAHLGLKIANPSLFLQLLRETILSNRRAFEANPSQIPNIQGTILQSLETSFGSEFSRMFEYWVQNVFVFTGQDFSPLSKWYILLALARTDRQRWISLGLPQGISEESRSKLEDIFDHNELHALADQIDKHPLSDWDIEMYSIHGFDDDENEPYTWVLETVKKRRFSSYLDWLVASLNDDQRRQLVDNANALKSQIETTRHFPIFQYLKWQV